MEERTLVDDKLKELRETVIDKMAVSDRSLALFASYLAEAFMRAHREIDDDIWHVKEQLERHGSDLSSAMGRPDDSGDFYEEGTPAGVGDGGTFLTERDLVNRALALAKQTLDSDLASHPQYAWCQIAYGLTLVNVHQVRDLDDTLSHFMGALTAHGAKVISAIPDFKESMKPPPEEKHKFFS